jgi:hypothetical protein
MLRLSPSLRRVVKKDPLNYRPISLLTSFSKIFEKIILTGLYQHVNKYHILANEQFGFRRQSSTYKASYVLLNKILEALNKQKIVDGIICDLKKAFDSVNQEILLNKLQFYGISVKFHDLITSYCTDLNYTSSS